MNFYVDIYANILPEMPVIDSGALTHEQAAERIAVFRRSNIKTAAAAPLFQPQLQPREQFLAQRDALIEASNAAGQNPTLVPGAVLPLQYCMDDLRGLQPFALGKSQYLLVDLPSQPITEEFCEALSRLRIVSGLCPVAVDIERHFDFWSPEDWLTLRQSGILLQISIDGLLNPEHRKLSLYLLANQYAHFVATGAHPIDEPLRFTETMRLLQRSLPAELYRRIKNNPGMLLSNAEPSSFL